VSSHPAGTSVMTRAAPVLMYHSIAAAAARRFRRFAVDPGEFAAQMDYLEAAGYHPLTAADLLSGWMPGRSLPPRPVVLTFDDAYADFYSAALPILRAHGFLATLFVATGYVGSTARWNRRVGEGNRVILSWQALRDIAAEGVEMAAHSHTHPQLDRLRPPDISDEVSRSRGLTQDTLSIPVEGFAYPYGYWNRAAREAVSAAGFRYGCAVSDLIAGPGDDVLTLPRLTVNAGIGVSGLARLLETRRTAGSRIAADAKRVAWRAARRSIPGVGGRPWEGQSAT
jgi:peptidoglycan/xylan/chitin deacetylase (PgdA/CDA1 family)